MNRCALIAVALLLTSCIPSTTGGTGGIDPAAQAASANATATVASAQVTSTVVAANATNSAAYVQATQAVMATAAIATQAAMPTVTAQAEYESVIAEGQATQNAIAADVQSAAATATAVHLQWLIDYDARTAAKQARVSEFWHWFRVVMLVLFAVAGWMATKFFIPAIYEWIMPPAQSIRDEDGRIVAIGKSMTMLPNQPPPVDIEQEPPPPIDGLFITPVNTPKANFTVTHPTPSGYRLWLARVIDNPRAEFSDRQRRAEGWSEAHFWAMITEMKRVGWLNTKPDSRGCYTMTDYGKLAAKEWLGYPPTPQEN